ncbi:tRNA dihydrouridine synthase DusB [Lampropedia aestuarii]|uniref:tRNA-dihydrouridine synthase B n=1 Tax=Lampropedia aestuarii TaxID=2562762 RepID=A0A4S5BN77_9BURK|nr:tRNA dihydrouridine synthase DusB [Lampropedia aestuarii]THJ31198.1 tRNA dihydrouridine synthase DusB [Lampropedia aestuarii]
MHIGSIELDNHLFVAPMAGVTDRPFRMLCRQLGAGYAVSEMVTSQPHLYASLKTSRRANHEGEPGPISVQIAGTEAAMMAEAARYNIERGAQIIDINMGCPAKKVCNAWAGSALMQNEPLAIEIAEAVVKACLPFGVPVTLKMRTGWSSDNKNAPVLAKAFESVGIQMLTVHGRTREQGYKGQAEYATVTAVKQAVRIPVVANGDINSSEKAAQVLQITGADAVMVGRAAQGRPWIFREIAHYLATGEHLAAPQTLQVRQWLLDHLLEHYSLYGEHTGVRSARKHIGWYIKGIAGQDSLRTRINAEQDCQQQWQAVADFLEDLARTQPVWPMAQATASTEPVADDEAACGSCSNHTAN